MSRPSLTSPRPRRRLRAAAAACALAAVALGSGAPGAGARTEPTLGTPSAVPARPPLAATVTSCTTGLDAADRTVVFSGSMPALRRATSMAMRFELYERPDGEDAFTRLRLPSFGAWVRSDPNVAGFVYDKHVQQLAAPSAYRVIVRFRWYDARGRIVRRTQRTSSVCREPDLRPDLRVSRVVIGAPRADGSALYTVAVRNTGASPILVPFATALVVDGILQPALSLPSLDAGATGTLIFTAPACTPGTPVAVAVDADRIVDEADESDDIARKPCAVG
jgi:hypothetical protein